jgi:Ca2+-binding EF-hand superfamily protein
MRPKLGPCLLVLLLAACGGQSQPPQAPAEFRSPRSILERYDANHDGIVSRAEAEQGLRAEFAQADAKQTGCLDSNEVRAVNDKRWQEDQSTYSPLVDFKQKGCVDFEEFAATVRSLFEQMDLNADGQVDQKELHPRHGR